MARARRPGAPGRTKIPGDVVKATTKRLKMAFKKTGDGTFADLAVIAQQHYLYLESIERPHEIMPGLIDARFAKARGRRRTPLARMVWTGDPERWRLELYKWSDERWDEENDACTAGGSPEECLVDATLGWG